LPVVSENLPDHNYIEQNSSVNSKRAEELKRENAMLTEKIQTLFEENNKLKSSNYYLKRKNMELGEKVQELKAKLEKVTNEYNLLKNNSELLKQCLSEVPYQLFESTTKSIKGINRDRVYHPAIRKFALALQLCSSKAYKYVFTFVNLVPFFNPYLINNVEDIVVFLY